MRSVRRERARRRRRLPRLCDVDLDPRGPACSRRRPCRDRVETAPGPFSRSGPPRALPDVVQRARLPVAHGDENYRRRRCGSRRTPDVGLEVARRLEDHEERSRRRPRASAAGGPLSRPRLRVVEAELAPDRVEHVGVGSMQADPDHRDRASDTPRTRGRARPPACGGPPRRGAGQRSTCLLDCRGACARSSSALAWRFVTSPA